jgi:curved DNA-binding protein CbpA
MLQPLLPYTPERDVYRLLGVPASASTDEITAACRRLARTFHPDYNASTRATAEMQVVNTVRRVLTDPETRAVYDRERQRFHASLVRPSWRVQPIELIPPRRSSPSMAVYMRAAVIGVRAAIAELLPSRCQRCRIVISGEDTFCAACGTPLLTGG